jgi:polyisoprenoid-binding protein YceI
VSTTTPTASATRQVAGKQVPAAGTYAIDASHSSVEFLARHLMISKVRGRFTEFSGELRIAENPEESTADVVIQSASIHTGDDKRDGHLRSADFFDTEQFPTLTFTGTKVEPDKGDQWKLHGELTVRDVTRPVVLDVEFDGAGVSPWNTTVVGFTAATELDREEWGLTWNQALETGGVLVGRKIRIELAVEAIRQD